MGPKAQEGAEQGDKTARALGCLLEPLITHTALLLWVHAALEQQRWRGGELEAETTEPEALEAGAPAKSTGDPTAQPAAGSIHGGVGLQLRQGQSSIS